VAAVVAAAAAAVASSTMLSFRFVGAGACPSSVEENLLG
jgi:hypothetical protein